MILAQPEIRNILDCQLTVTIKVAAGYNFTNTAWNCFCSIQTGTF